MRILKDSRERNLLILATFAFIILFFIEVGTKLHKNIFGTFLDSMIENESIMTISSGLCISIIAAYVFYLFIDFVPRAKRERDTKTVLDSLLASVFDSFNRRNVFGHETPISHVDKTVLGKRWLNETKETLMAQKADFLSLKFAMQTADSRLEDFRHALPLAVSLSPERAMQWLVIIDKIRLLSENYGNQPEATNDQLHLIDHDSDENPLKQYKSDLNLRLIELVEQSILWQGLATNENL